MKSYRGYQKILILGEANGRNKFDQFKYEKRVEEALDDVIRTRTGKILLDAIDQTKREVWIMPGRDSEGISGTSEVATEGVVDTGRSTYDALRAGTRRGTAIQYYDRDNPDGICRVQTLEENGKPVIGEGTGNSSCIIQFTPWFLEASSKVTPGIALFHELIHAYRDLIGKLDKQPTCDDYDTYEETVAILFENIHRSEWKKLGRNTILRYDHHGIKELPLYLQNPSQYFDAYRARIMQVRYDMYWFSEQFYAINDIAFNPLRFAPR